jgi:hypothetical protein
MAAAKGAWTKRGLGALPHRFPLPRRVRHSSPTMFSREIARSSAVVDFSMTYYVAAPAGVEPRFVPFDGDPYSFVIDKNVHRRHLNESQRALIAAQIATRPHGGGRHPDIGIPILPIPPTVSQAAKLLNVDPSTVSQARTVLHKATREEIDAVKKGKQRVTAVYKSLDKAPEERAATARSSDGTKGGLARIQHT